MRTNRHFCRRNMSDQSNNPIPLGEIVQGPSAFEQFLDRNQKMMAFSAIAVALGVGGFMVYKTIAEDHALSAGAAYSSAQDIADLEKVKQEYADTAASATASLAIAEKQWGNKQEDEAISTLRQLIQDFPKHPAAAIAQQTLGNRLLAQGKTGDAELAFQAVIDNPQSAYLAPAALVALGDIAKKAGDLTKAEERVKKIVTDAGGKITATDNWGKRKLMYPIKKEEHAVYVFYTVELPGECVKKVETTLNITDEVLRYLIVRPDLKKIAKAEADKAEKAKKAAERGDRHDNDDKDESEE